jgi:hypothetical protein
MSKISGIKFIDSLGVLRAFKWNADAPQICAQSYLQAMAEGDISGHTAWSKIGYAVMPATTETDLYSYGGTVPVIPLMTGGATRRVVTAHAADEGVIIKGDATGDTVTADAGGSTTTLVDADVDFTAAGGTAAVDVGDCIILDPHGTTPEWGYVTIVAAHVLTVANGFSSGGTGASRKYAVLDYDAQAGCHAVLLNYLDSTYTTKREIVVTNGNVANGVVTIGADIFRINSFRVMATGSAGKPTGAILLGNNSTPPTIVYSYITAGYTRARNSIYTVPANKTLYIVQWNAGFAANAANKVEYARLYLRAAQYMSDDGTVAFRTNVTAGIAIWYPYAEVLASAGTVSVPIESPIKILPKTSLKVSAAASGVGVASSIMRGWLE